VTELCALLGFASICAAPQDSIQRHHLLAASTRLLPTADARYPAIRASSDSGALLTMSFLSSSIQKMSAPNPSCKVQHCSGHVVRVREV
jgi:hypothetical protein